MFTKIPKFDQIELDLNNYTCDLCGKSFEREIQYYGHLQKHSGERNWKCGTKNMLILIIFRITNFILFCRKMFRKQYL